MPMRAATRTMRAATLRLIRRALRELPRGRDATDRSDMEKAYGTHGDDLCGTSWRCRVTRKRSITRVSCAAQALQIIGPLVILLKRVRWLKPRDADVNGESTSPAVQSVDR